MLVLNIIDALLKRPDLSVDMGQDVPSLQPGSNVIIPRIGVVAHRFAMASAYALLILTTVVILVCFGQRQDQEATAHLVPLEANADTLVYLQVVRICFNIRLRFQLLWSDFGVFVLHYVSFYVFY
ncbi:unnamed protein product [Haemonchus placei]|uniref:Transmembrane protein n=1 Tax=Haemonchus placei TaxID=6290 RepID=A0A0N4WQS9_HAEPC|nr:unnamed protein product [Haemonchus placei]